MILPKKTALVGILGNPVSHSLSPIMHNAALKSLGLNWLYIPLPINNTSLEILVQNLSNIDCRGFNITIPHKEIIAQLATELTPIAKRVGAVNTFIREPNTNNGWLGTNTDVEGFINSLKNNHINLSQKRAVILGCGGSARAILVALVELGVASIRVIGRDIYKLTKFTDNYQYLHPDLSAVTWNETESKELELKLFEKTLTNADLIVNTTPIGMTNVSISSSALLSPLTESYLDRLKSNVVIYDLIYTPRPTVLLKKSAERGFICIDGLEMLVEQGAASLKLWTGLKSVPTNIMRNSALNKLRN
uniref:Shikimate / quinate 5-dehydrogenase n=1 Tax=Paulinella chromatophora TaxID=39717 RepID=B1X4G8_PAUCH|nr:shikimate / quinate 5-dehydrogenase [Paulinella chromatophora]ACB42837.1 shikimate / quinate 5-dehydrogenase [Paulinella chromatophora]